MTLTFGKFKGSELSDLPLNYLEWMVGNVVKQWSDLAQQEIQRRRAPTTGISTKVPKQVFVEELAALLRKMPDLFLSGEWEIKLDGKVYFFRVRVQ